METYFITGNKNKFDEAKKIMPDLKQIEIDLAEIQEIDAHKIIEQKLREAIKHHVKGRLVIEDTSLYFECLKGLPGPLIKWFLERIGTKGLYDIADKFNNYEATAKTIVGYYDGKEIRYFEGEVKGRIVPPKGKAFGWDPIFVPNGYEKRFNEISKEEKNNISMRGIAFKKLKNYLDKN